MTPRAERSSATFHRRNRHQGQYNFPALVAAAPWLKAFLRPTGFGHDSIDFADAAAVKALNQALLKKDYGIATWDIPPGYLCPPIPGRADSIHHLADLLAEAHGGSVPTGPKVTVLDVGVGANCVYPIIARREYGWSVVASDIDPIALRNARKIADENPKTLRNVDFRLQRIAGAFFAGIIAPGEHFAATLCNPPFFSSAAEADAATRRKIRNLHGKVGSAPSRNFSGTAQELWCPGGEEGFVRRMVEESAAFAQQCHWFTSLIAKKDHVAPIHRAARRAGAVEFRTIELAQGQKRTRLVAWSFHRQR